MEKTIWEAKIPVKIHTTLSDADLLAPLKSARCNAITIMMSRCSYLPLYSNQIRKILSDMGYDIPKDISEVGIWYSHKGLLFDIHCGKSASSRAELPWSVQVHFDPFPDTVLLPISSFDTLSQLYFHAIKQADFLWNGSTKSMTALTKNEQNSLWEGLMSDDYEKYLNVSRKLRGEGEMPRNIPIRLYRRVADGFDVVTFQDLFAPLDDEENAQTLGSILPLVFSENDTKDRRFELILHGVKIPLETPILWLAYRMYYPDGFLHIYYCESL